MGNESPTSSRLIREDLKKKGFRNFKFKKLVDILAVIFGLVGAYIGLLFSQVHLTGLYDAFGRFRSGPSGIDFIVAAIFPVIGFIAGAAFIYSIIYGGALILRLTKEYWYIFIILFASLIWWLN